MLRPETFSSRGAIIVAGLGMAVGTGNLWRFPRIAAQNGGAVFLIPWMLFLVAWSLPLLIAEFGLGRGARRGPVGTFVSLVGEKYAWMGGFVAVTTIMIMFYYSVVTGWMLKYFVASVTAGAPRDPEAYWAAYSTSVWQPIMFHVLAVLAGITIVARRVVSGIERANKLLIPALFVLLLVAVVRSVTLEGADQGLAFLFRPDLSALLNYRTWLEALTQSAWSTGAGWGLILTYAVYVKRDEDVVVSSAAIGLGNNTASLLAGMAILPTAFAILSTSDALEAMAAGNTGLTFIWIPQLFAQVPAGAFILPVFFLALFCAALSSLIAMIELASRVLIDAGSSRRVAVRMVGLATVVCGIPSAISPAVFENQDWVWGLALMISVPCGDGRNPSPSGEEKSVVVWSRAPVSPWSAHENGPQRSPGVDPEISEARVDWRGGGSCARFDPPDSAGARVGSPVRKSGTRPRPRVCFVSPESGHQHDCPVAEGDQLAGAPSGVSALAQSVLG